MTTTTTNSTTTPKLSDLHLVLLSAAARREGGSVLPVPEGLKARGAALERSLGKLLAQGLVEEVAAREDETGWRLGEEGSVGLRISAAGLDALGLGKNSAGPDSPIKSDPGGASTRDEIGAGAMNAPETVEPTPPTAPRAGTKLAGLIALLDRPEGASIEALTGALGWLPHTVRAALTGLRKKGYAVMRDARAEGSTTIYRIAVPAAADAA